MHKILGAIIPFFLVCGCASSDNEKKTPGTHLNWDGSVTVVQSRAGVKRRSEIGQLINSAHNGDGKAAYDLGVYYDSIEYNPTYAAHYHGLAEKLNYPHELFRIAMRDWSGNPTPDLEKIENYAKKAAQAGVNSADELLAEIVAARTTGTIPDKTKLRSIPTKEEMLLAESIKPVFNKTRPTATNTCDIKFTVLERIWPYPLLYDIPTNLEETSFETIERPAVIVKLSILECPHPVPNRPGTFLGVLENLYFVPLEEGKTYKAKIHIRRLDELALPIVPEKVHSSTPINALFLFEVQEVTQ